MLSRRTPVWALLLFFCPGFPAAEGAPPQVAVLRVETVPAQVEAGAALFDGERLYLIEADGSLSATSASGGGWMAPPPHDFELGEASRLLPHAEGVLRSRWRGEARALQGLDLYSPDRGARTTLALPHPEITDFWAVVDGGMLHLAGAVDGGLFLWSRAGGDSEWGTVSLPPGLRHGQALGLDHAHGRLHMILRTGEGAFLWSHSMPAGWEKVAALPGVLATGGVTLKALSATHLGFMRTEAENGQLWSLSLPSGAWTAYPLETPVRYAGAFSGDARSIGAFLGWVAHPDGGVSLTTVQLLPHSPRFGTLNYIALALYLTGTMGIGLYFMYRTKNTNDYFLAGGRIPWWAAGISVYATMLSPITVMAMSGKSYLTNWTFLLAPAMILVLAPVVMRWYLPFFRQLRAASAYEYLERRFHHNLRIYAGLAFIIFQTGRMAIVIFLPSLALSTVCGLDIYLCVLLMGGVCTVYTMLGGIEGVIWNDVLQTIVMLGSAVLCIVYVAFSIDGGFLELAGEALADGKAKIFDWSFSFVHASTWIIVLGSLINNLVPYTSDQTIIQRYMTVSSEAMARRSIWLNGFMSPPSALVFFALGTGFYLFYKHNPGALHPAIVADSMLPYFVHENLPAGIAGVVIAGIFAASQSSVSSSLNSVATVLVTDMIPARRGLQSESAELWIARLTTVITGIICTGLAMLMAGRSIDSFFDSYLKLVAITGSGLAGLFALGIFSRRANALGAGCGVVASAFMVYFVQRHTDLHFFFYGMTGFSVCFFVGLVCLRGRARSEASLAGLTWSTRLKKNPD